MLEAIHQLLILLMVHLDSRIASQPFAKSLIEGFLFLGRSEASMLDEMPFGAEGDISHV